MKHYYFLYFSIITNFTRILEQGLQLLTTCLQNRIMEEDFWIDKYSIISNKAGERMWEGSLPSLKVRFRHWSVWQDQSASLLINMNLLRTFRMWNQFSYQHRYGLLVASFVFHKDLGHVETSICVMLLHCVNVVSMISRWLHLLPPQKGSHIKGGNRNPSSPCVINYGTDQLWRL